jgi:hypothetical protein
LQYLDVDVNILIKLIKKIGVCVCVCVCGLDYCGTGQGEVGRRGGRRQWDDHCFGFIKFREFIYKPSDYCLLEEESDSYS